MIREFGNVLMIGGGVFFAVICFWVAFDIFRADTRRWNENWSALRAACRHNRGKKSLRSLWPFERRGLIRITPVIDRKRNAWTTHAHVPSSKLLSPPER